MTALQSRFAKRDDLMIQGMIEAMAEDLIEEFHNSIWVCPTCGRVLFL